MKFRITSVVLLAAASLVAQTPSSTPSASAAPDPAKVPVIDELFRLTKPDAMIQQMLLQYKSAFGSAAQNGFNNEVRKIGDDPTKYQTDFQQLENKLFALMSSRLDWNKLKPQFVKAYSDTFSKDELTSIVNFYKSPAGKAEIEKMPGLMAKCSNIGQQQMASAGPEMQKMMTDFMDGIKKKSQSSHPASAAPAKK